jgi:hypothetical protein
MSVESVPPKIYYLQLQWSRFRYDVRAEGIAEQFEVRDCQLDSNFCVVLTCEVGALFAWLISHQPTVLLPQNKPATTNQPAVLFSQNKPAPAISHQPNEQAEGQGCTPYI